MLYNYPKKHIFDFLERIRSQRGRPPLLTPGGNEPDLRLHPSLASHGGPRGSALGFPEPCFSMRLASVARLSRADLQSPGLRQQPPRVRNKSAQLGNFNPFYSTVNSSIKYIADIVYQEVGEGPKKSQMSFANFKIWIAQNKGILQTFDKWLRRDIWGSPEARLPRPSSIPSSPAPAQGFALVNAKKKRAKVKLYKKLFLVLQTNILKLFADSKRSRLVHVYILKDLQISFAPAKRKIKIFHPVSPEYRNLTLVLSDKEAFFQWKRQLEPFMLESVEKHYLFHERIGRGTFSTVNRVEKKGDSSRRFAIKTIDKECLTSEERTLIREEAKIIQGLSHEHIVKFYEHFDDYKKVYYVLELVEGGDLLEHVLSRKRLGEPEARRVFRQLVNVVGYLHRNNILHRDLKPENILIDLDAPSGEVSTIKLIDFGFATFFCRENLPSLSCGTLNYAAPEVLLGEEYDESSDLFSCGVILYFM